MAPTTTIPAPVHEAAGFRIYPTEVVTDRNGEPTAMALCEEFDAESGRWEPFYTLRSIGAVR